MPATQCAHAIPPPQISKHLPIKAMIP